MRTHFSIIVSCFALVTASLQAGVRINEFMASNGGVLTAKDGGVYDWIEFYNSGDQPVNLEGYYLTDDETLDVNDAETYWRFPEVTLAADEYLIVYASGLTEPPAEGEGDLHATFKLARDGERLALIEPDGTTVVTEFTPTFPSQETNVSYGLGTTGDLQFMTTPTPGKSNKRGVDGFVSDVQFSVDRGFFDGPFEVTLTTATEDAEILYTIDAQLPAEATLFQDPTGELYEGPITIDKTTVIRARAFKKGMAPSVNRTQTYVFLDDVLDQQDLPDGFPEKWGSRNSDYEMDPEVIGPIYSRDEVKQALLAAPSISLVAEMDDLFGRDGIYTNSQAKDNVNDGIEDQWERPVSVEMLGFPHGQTIQANAGIRMQGNASRSPNRVKHNMRVIFRSEYGPGKLRFRLFEDTEVETFNSINLRSNNGDSWIHPGVRLRAQYIRDQWHRVVQRDMNQPNQSQIYAHVYINGLYWGMYHVFERFEASLLSEHFGGDESNWDALQDTPAFQDIVVNGDDEAYRLTHDLAKEDMSVQENYDKVLEYVDVDNQIDYLVMNFYSGNQDWDHKNMRYGRRRAPMEGAMGNGWMYFAWDSERAGLNGLNTQSVTMDNTTKVTNLGPSALNDAMHDNPDYHLRFADRVVKHFFRGGALTPEGAAKTWNDTAALVYEPLIGESARWGDLHVSTPETREGNWQTQLDKENEIWFPQRTDVVLGQFASRGWIPRMISFPDFKPFGGQVEEGTQVTARIFNDSIFNPINGDIYFTTNGTDPRLPDGSLDPDAIKLETGAGPVIDHSQWVMGRVYDPDGDWSPVAEAYFHLAALPTKDSLTISEIHYDPAPANAEEEAAEWTTANFEFVELWNRGSETLDLSGVHFSNGVRARIQPEDKVLVPAGERVVLVANREAFQSRYPHVSAAKIAGVFENESNLADGGERLTLRDYEGQLLHTVRYDNNAPWPTKDDDVGLEFIGNGEISIANPDAWVVSSEMGGSPAAEAGEAGGPTGSFSEWLTARGYTSAMEVIDDAGRTPFHYYAFGVDAAPHSEAFDALSVQRRGETLVVSYDRRPGAGDLTWVTEASSDLETWIEAAPAGTSATVNGSRETVSMEFASDTAATYWRLRLGTR